MDKANTALSLSSQSSTSSQIAKEQSRQIAEVQASLTIAKNFPRNVTQSIDRIVNSCSRVNLAENSMYQYSKGGSKISGASIRLAEAVAQQWGNLEYGIRQVEQTDDYTVTECYCWDMETNVRQSITVQTKHERYSKKNGRQKIEESREVYELVANNSARRLRKAIMGVIPQDVFDTALEACEKTLHTKVDLTPDRIKELQEKFNKEFSVTRDMLEKRIQCKIERITPKQFIDLGRIFNSMKDGMSDVNDWFDKSSLQITSVETESEAEKAKNESKTQDKTQKAENKKEEAK